MLAVTLAAGVVLVWYLNKKHHLHLTCNKLAVAKRTSHHGEVQGMLKSQTGDSLATFLASDLSGEGEGEGDGEGQNRRRVRSFNKHLSTPTDASGLSTFHETPGGTRDGRTQLKEMEQILKRLEAGASVRRASVRARALSYG